MIFFITKTEVCNVLNFISNDSNDESLALSAMNFFEEFISQWVSSDGYSESTSVVKDCLNIIVEKLVPFASKNDSLGKYNFFRSFDGIEVPRNERFSWEGKSPII